VIDVPQVKVIFPSARALLSSVNSDNGRIALFAAVPPSFNMGTTLDLMIRIAGHNQDYRLIGKVTRVIPTRTDEFMTPGLMVNFDAAEKVKAAQMVAALQGRALSQGTARVPRKQVHAGCWIRVGGERTFAWVKDISLSGMFVASDRLGRVLPGTLIELEITPGVFGVGGQRLKATVIWVGHKGDHVGAGAKFLEPPNRVAPAINQLAA
jgi:hypothetical protein